MEYKQIGQIFDFSDLDNGEITLFVKEGNGSGADCRGCYFYTNYSYRIKCASVHICASQRRMDRKNVYYERVGRINSDMFE